MLRIRQFFSHYLTYYSKAVNNLPARAFTMIELVVSISIIMMLTIMFVANYHSSNKRTDLIMASQNLVANLHLAQNNSLGLVKYAGVVPAGGWGLHFNKASSTYVLFADLQAPGHSGYMVYNSSIEGDIDFGARFIKLPLGIVISNLQTSRANQNFSVSQVNVSFLPPDPQTNIYNPVSGATSTQLTIQLKETSSNVTKTIKINFLGLAEVID